MLATGVQEEAASKRSQASRSNKGVRSRFHNLYPKTRGFAARVAGPPARRRMPSDYVVGLPD